MRGDRNSDRLDASRERERTVEDLRWRRRSAVSWLDDADHKRWPRRENPQALCRRRQRRRRFGDSGVRRRRGGPGGRGARRGAGPVVRDAQRLLHQPRIRLRLVLHLGVPRLLLHLPRVPDRRFAARPRRRPREARPRLR